MVFAIRQLPDDGCRVLDANHFRECRVGKLPCRFRRNAAAGQMEKAAKDLGFGPTTVIQAKFDTGPAPLLLALAPVVVTAARDIKGLAELLNRVFAVHSVHPFEARESLHSSRSICMATPAQAQITT